MATPPLGWIEPKDRDSTLEHAHQTIQASMPKFVVSNLPVPSLAKGDKVSLTKAWSDPNVVKEIGFVFPRFHQLTGSCVGAGGGQALFTLIAVQRTIAASPTIAKLPYWPLNYGRSRALAGMRGRGEGSMGSFFAKACQEGVVDALNPDAKQFATFQMNDGLVITSQEEMNWSDGNSNLVMQNVPLAKFHPLGTASELTSVQDIKACILNGYPCTFACDRYIGHGSVKGSTDDTKGVFGKWDSNGGHQQSVHDYWEHPDFGPSYLVLNNWPASSYPTLPNQPVCSTWVLEADVQAAFNYHSEVYGLSHLNWFPAQPDILDTYV